MTPVVVARVYLGAQALAGLLWWVSVFASDDVRRWTLGGWDPAVVVGPDLVLFVGASAVAALWASRAAALVAALWTVAVAVALGLHGLLRQEAGAGVVLMAIAGVGTVAAAATMWFGHLPTRWFFVGPFSFREAGEAPSSGHLTRSLGQLVVFWSVFFVGVPLVLSGVERRLGLRVDALDGAATSVLGVVLFALGSALGLWSCATMALRGRGTPLPARTARDMVVSGPYRWVRNPMAVAGVVQTLGVGLWVGSWMVVAVGPVGATAWHLVIRPAEEADLAERFGEPYRRYRQQVRCWVPRAQPFATTRR